MRAVALTRGLKNVSAEMSLAVLAYNLKRTISIMGVAPLLAAIRAQGGSRVSRPELHQSEHAAKRFHTVAVDSSAPPAKETPGPAPCEILPSTKGDQPITQFNAVAGGLS